MKKNEVFILALSLMETARGLLCNNGMVKSSGGMYVATQLPEEDEVYVTAVVQMGDLEIAHSYVTGSTLIAEPEGELFDIYPSTLNNLTRMQELCKQSDHLMLLASYFGKMKIYYEIRAMDLYPVQVMHLLSVLAGRVKPENELESGMAQLKTESAVIYASIVRYLVTIYRGFGSLHPMIERDVRDLITAWFDPIHDDFKLDDLVSNITSDLNDAFKNAQHQLQLKS